MSQSKSATSEEEEDVHCPWTIRVTRLPCMMSTSAATVLVYSAGGPDHNLQDGKTPPRFTCLVWIKSANSLYAAGEAGTVSLFSIPKQCLVETIKHTQDPVYSMAQNKDGSTLAMGSRNIHICD